MQIPFDGNKVHRSWIDFFSDDNVLNVLRDIEHAIGNDYYPEHDQVLRFAQNDLSNVKHIIVGMDPYPSWNNEMNCPQATGRSFEVSELIGKGWDYKIKQSSLRNILKAVHFNQTRRKTSLQDIRKEIEDGSFAIAAPTKWFDSLEQQGVLFLNSTLTVKPDNPGSHRTLWQPFRELLIPYLSNRNITWHLWGNDAQKEYGNLLSNNEKILSSCHPRLANFVEENTFSKAPDIDWCGLKNYPNI